MIVPCHETDIISGDHRSLILKSMAFERRIKLHAQRHGRIQFPD